MSFAICACWANCLRSCCRCIPQRYILSTMLGVGMINTYTMRLVLNIAITVMAKPTASKVNVTVLPGTCPAPPGYGTSSHPAAGVVGEFGWTQSEQGILLSSFYWLYGVAHVPGGEMAQRCGGKNVLLVALFLAALLTLVTPVVTRVGGLYALVVVRVIVGIMTGPTFPAVSTLIANWVPKNEKSFHHSVAFSGVIFGSMLTNALSGVILEATDNAWDLLFYVFGGATIVWCLLFWLFCSNEPWDHPFISQAEHDFLNAELLDVTHGKTKPPTPWWPIVTSLPVIALVIGQLGHTYIFFAFTTDLPKYMTDVLHFKVKEMGFYSALPYICEWIVALISGKLADLTIRREWMSTINVRRLLATISTVLPSVALIVASHGECNKALVVTAFALSLGLMGTFYPSVRVNGMDLSPNYAGILMGVVNGIGALSGVIAPMMIGQLTPNSTLLEWRLAFYVISLITCVFNVIFCVFASGSVQAWNQPKVAEAPT